VLSIVPSQRRRTGPEPYELPSLRRRKPLRPRLVLRYLPREEAFLVRRRRLQLRPRDVLRRPRPRRCARAVQATEVPG